MKNPTTPPSESLKAEPTITTVDVPIHQELGPFKGAKKALGVSVAGDAIWYATGDSIVSLNPSEGTPRQRLDVKADAGTAFDGTYLYQLTDATIQKIDPETGEVLSRIPAPAEGRDSGMAWAEGSLWVGEYRAGKIHRIDPKTGKVLAVIHSDRFVTGVAWHQGELWHGAHHGERSELCRIEQDGRVQERLRLPEGITVAGVDIDAHGHFLCGGGDSGKIRIVKRPGER